MTSSTDKKRITVRGARRRMTPPQDAASANQRCEAMLARMAAIGSPRNVEGQKRFGIAAVKAYGLAAEQMHGLAREAGCDHALAEALWRSGVHDARHVAAMVADPQLVTEEMMERWARDFASWDVVDTCCCYLFCRTRFGWKKANAWSRRPEEFVKRAGFSMMAYLALHDKAAPDAKFLKLLPIIHREATDERNFVRKAVNWALRQIGKRSLMLNRAAIAAGKRIRKRNTHAARWIAAGALRELRSDAVQKRLRERARRSKARPR